MVRRKEGKIVTSLNLFQNVWIKVVGLGVEVAAEGCLRVCLDQRKVETAVIIDEKGLVIADKLSPEA